MGLAPQGGDAAIGGVVEVGGMDGHGGINPGSHLDANGPYGLGVAATCRFKIRVRVGFLDHKHELDVDGGDGVAPFIERGDQSSTAPAQGVAFDEGGGEIVPGGGSGSMIFGADEGVDDPVEEFVGDIFDYGGAAVDGDDAGGRFGHAHQPAAFA